MKKPEIGIKGFHGYDYCDAVEICEMSKRTFIRQALEASNDGQPFYYAECHTVSSGDTLILVLRNKRTGEREVYDLKVRAHYLEDQDGGLAAVEKRLDGV